MMHSLLLVAVLGASEMPCSAFNEGVVGSVAMCTMISGVPLVVTRDLMHLQMAGDHFRQLLGTVCEGGDGHLMLNYMESPDVLLVYSCATNETQAVPIRDLDYF